MEICINLFSIKKNAFNDISVKKKGLIDPNLILDPIINLHVLKTNDYFYLLISK